MYSKRIRKTTAELDARAKELRRRETPAERVLWRRLRKAQVMGYNFRRQHPVGRAILDFYCPKGRLCVELDGPIHDRTHEYDAARDANLAAHGVRVIRFRNGEIFADIEDVLARIRAALPAPRDPEPADHPSPR
ncbi:MAG TPA: DUF559 domain-containing protein [Longimicrobium sp.]